MLEAKAYERAGLNFGEHACAVTGEGSAWTAAESEGWLKRFPMGLGRSTGNRRDCCRRAARFDIDQLLVMAACDELTRQADAEANPAARLALAADALL